jgi:hypothetical protein
MLAHLRLLPGVLGLAVIVAAASAACGGGGSGSNDTFGTGSDASMGDGSVSSEGGGRDTGTPSDGGGLINGDGSSCTTGFDVQPSTMQTITVKIGGTTPTVTFKATLDCQPVSAGWTVDKGNVGSVPLAPAAAAVFTPTGTTGGVVTVTAGLNGKTLTRQILVKLVGTQNGPNSSPGETAQIPTTSAQLTSGGGVGGVGGEGLGTPVTDTTTTTALGSPTGNGSAQGLGFIYPYDKTVWPRGILAPLLQWTWTPPGGAYPGDADAIAVSLKTTTGSFSWTGTFGRPTILGTTGKFIRMPIPQDVWDMATNTAGGQADQLTVSLTVAKGGMGYGPISETWTIAPARLDGTIYYNSYGTQLAQNYGGAVGGNGLFGGAVLSIHVGDTAPKLVAGTNSTPPDISGCRVCHSVAASGARLVVQHGDNYGVSSAYDLGTITEHVMTNDATFPAVYPDGTMALTSGGTLLPLPTDTTPIATTGLTTLSTSLGNPAFSPDGTKLVFNPQAGTIGMVGTSVWVMSFDKTTMAFSGPVQVAQTTGSTKPGWPAFFPDSKSVVYEQQTVASSCDGPGSLETRSGARSQLYWTNLAGSASATAMDNLNGKGYLPKLPAASTVACSDACGTAASPTIGTLNADHSDDVDVNYEPTVAPVASGGYAWVVFTSRRMYGTVADIGSFCSDPRGVDLITNITPKKLWVAAIDLTQKPGTDASHPAFYLPAQELLAGNARGFWTLDPCKSDGSSCMSGDQCCNGYCEPGEGGLVCTNAPPSSSCSALGDKCKTAADCCDTTNACIGGFCAVTGPQ